jgi:ribonuclease D
LCLVQVGGAEEAAAIDPMADGLVLDPLFELLANPQVLKVFHAARQDLEIFFQLTGRLPAPLFDSQVAGMVCGFGDAASYETLAARLAGARIDKSFRFTDWSKRPLSERQITYALGDVTHLRPIYEKLSKRLHATGRERWVDEEMAILSDPATYRLDPETAWIRLKPRGGSAKFLNVLKSVAAWREAEAQRRDLPRNRLVRDEALLEIAAQAPATVADLARTRGMSKGTAEGVIGEGLLAAVKRGLAAPADQAPKLADKPELPPGRGPLVDLLKVLLKLKCEVHHVAQKLVANTADLEAIACSDDAAVPALQGWRREVFGADALALKQGRLALTAAKDAIRVVELAPS